MLLAPAPTPKPIAEKPQPDMTRIMSDADMQPKASIIGLLPIDPPSIAATENICVPSAGRGALARKLGLKLRLKRSQ